MTPTPTGGRGGVTDVTTDHGAFGIKRSKQNDYNLPLTVYQSTRYDTPLDTDLAVFLLLRTSESRRRAVPVG